jgi:hypothetical protein
MITKYYLDDDECSKITDSIQDEYSDFTYDCDNANDDECEVLILTINGENFNVSINEEMKYELSDSDLEPADSIVDSNLDEFIKKVIKYLKTYFKKQKIEDL